MSKANQDPFYAVRDDVTSQVDKIKIKLDQFQHLVKNSNTATSNEFKELKKRITRDIKKVDKDVDGLNGAVTQIEKNRIKFPHVKDQELNQRKKFVTDTQTRILDIKRGMDSPAIRKKIEDDEAQNRRLINEQNSERQALNSVNENENEDFVRRTGGRTHEMIQQQDASLDHLSTAVSGLERMGHDINIELKEQNKMLSAFEQDLEEAQSKMNFVMSSLSKLLKTKDGCQLWTVAILSLVLIILIALVVFV